MQVLSNIKEDELISVIIPVYNVEEYLGKCLDSIIMQSYRNFEVILINDGSSDNSLKICEKYADKDKRIVLVNQNNSGVSKARNVGLLKAKGKYITFIDSDDTVDSRYLEILYRNLKSTKADISMCTWNCKENIVYNDRHNLKCWSRQQTFLNMFKTKKIDGSVCSKLYRRECVENLFFDENLKIGEDQLFAIKAIEKASKVVFQEIPLYTYFIRTTSAMNSKLDSRYWDVVYRAEWLVNKAASDLPEMRGLFRKEEINIYVTMIIRNIKSGTDESKEIVDYVWPRVKKARCSEFVKYSNAYEFIRFVLVKYFYSIACYIVKAKNR